MYWKLVFLPNKKPVFSENYKNIKSRNFRYLRHFSSFIQRKNMRPIFSKYCLFILLAFCFFNCKTYQKVDWIKPSLPKEERSVSFELRQLSRLLEGDSLNIALEKGKSRKLIFEKIENDSLKGLVWQENNFPVKKLYHSGVLLSDIKELKVSRVNVPVTIGFVTYLIASLVIMVIYIESFELL